MKKIVFALALSLVTLVGVAQNALPKSKAPEGAR
ncbi:MAG TPA: rod shape-determining protein RodA, partial [Verrucomicrobiales bacterium]|nr:rod shape-determining protein RodA [Verrucomicrobiales bacterium]